MNPSQLIDKRIAELDDWRGETFAKLRKLVLEADPDITEEWKWDTAVWSHDGLVCALAAFKDNVGLSFFKGASLPDPHKLFNAGLEAKISRAVKFYKGDTIDGPPLKALIRAAVAYNKTKK
jgi:hypothetical protein